MSAVDTDMVTPGGGTGTTNEEPKNKAKKKKAPTRDIVLQKLKHQVEFYFGDSNLPKDEFIQNQFKENDGWLPIEKLLTFGRIKRFCRELNTEDEALWLAALTEALKMSKQILVVSEDGTRVQRNPKVPVPIAPSDESYERTVAVFGLPASLEWNVDEQLLFWGQFGGVTSVRRYVPQGRNKGKQNHNKNKTCIVFVEFDSKEIAAEALEAEELDYDGHPVNIKPRTKPVSGKKRKRGRNADDQTPRKRKRMDVDGDGNAGGVKNPFVPDRLVLISDIPCMWEWRILTKHLEFQCGLKVRWVKMRNPAEGASTKNAHVQITGSVQEALAKKGEWRANPDGNSVSAVMESDERQREVWNELQEIRNGFRAIKHQNKKKERANSFGSLKQGEGNVHEMRPEGKSEAAKTPQEKETIL